ncbi:MAG: SusC/RagA family TonB-linked outer membrane protein [Ferruginibacter sp.]|nr:SusC/RagA family TonB-linked outer membrane protein [Ferruginibacter sp.]
MKQSTPKLIRQLFAFAIICLPFFSTAQNITVKGKITDASSGNPIQSANITNVKNPSIGTISNADGEFSLSVPKGEKLSISFIGFETKNVSANDNFLSIQLNADSKQLSDVVVTTALGIKKEIKKIGYAIQEVKGSELVKAREPNAVNGLKGKVAGLNVNITPELLRTPSINFRGDGNILFVVDGVPIKSDTWNISPDDIESYTFLKGQTAGSLYGALAQNGAIIINTKKGTKDKRGFSIEFNSSTMFEKGFLSFPRYQSEYGPGSQGKYAYKDGIGGGLNDNDYDIWGPRFEGQLIPQYDGIVTPNQTYTTTFANGQTFTGNVKPTPWIARGTDNLDKYLNTGIVSTNHIAIASHTENSDIRFGLGHTYQKGIVPNTDLNTTNFNLAASYNLSSKFKVSANINYSHQYTKNFPDVNYGPNSLIYNVIIWAGSDWDMNDMRNYWQDGKVGIQQKYNEYQRYNNPWFMAYEWLRGHYKNDTYAYLNMDWKISKNLSLMFRPGISTYDLTRTEKMPVSAGSYERNDRKGDYREDRRSLFEANNEMQLKYNKRFYKDLISVDGFIGGNLNTIKYAGNYSSTDYLTIPGLYTLSNSLNKPIINSWTADQLVLSGYYSFDFGLSKYATISTTGRYDKHSNLPLANNKYFYYSVGAATALSDYLKLPTAISFAKFKTSYATGRDAGIQQTVGPLGFSGNPIGYGDNYLSPYGITRYAFSSNYNYTTGNTYNNALGATYVNGLNDPSIKAGNKKTIEVGADIRFIQNRIGFDVTWYKTVNELLTSRSVSPASGYTSLTENTGIYKYKNTGLEAVISGNIIKSKNLKWDLIINFSTYKRVWIKNPSPNNWVKDGDRIDLVYNNFFVRTPDGQLVHNSAGVLLTASELGSPANRIFGHSDPDWSWGVINNIAYKNFKLGFQFDGVVGGVMHNYIRQKTLQGGRHLETTEGEWGAARQGDITGGTYIANGIVLVGTPVLDPVTGEITNWKSLSTAPNTTKTTVQNYVSRYASIFDQNIISKTFAKLREVTLTYNLPQNVFGGKLFKQASVSFVGRNLLLFYPSRYKDVDPDQFTQSSATDLQTPTTRRFGFNINLTF